MVTDRSARARADVCSVPSCDRPFYDEANTSIRRGKRHCRACERDRSRERRTA